MRFLMVLAGCAAALATSAAAQQSEIAACNYAPDGSVDNAACAKAAPPGSGEQRLALINLGTDAFLRGDYADAVRLYDEATKDVSLRSDATFHAYRGAAYARVGRRDEALADARTAVSIMRGEGPQLPSPPTSIEALYPYILPILHEEKDPGFQAALAEYLAAPGVDWISYANRAGVLASVNEHAKAWEAAQEALRLAPNHPAVLSNTCYLLTEMKRAEDALPYCEQALQVEPGAAVTYATYADTLIALGRCREAVVARNRARELDTATADYQKPVVCPAPAQ